MKHRWTQTYQTDSKYNRLFKAQQLLDSARLAQMFDAIEPIKDLSEAKAYLDKFRLTE
jgi:hypothetical protein